MRQQKKETTNATWRIAALHDRAAGPRAHQGVLCRCARARDRQPPAARFPGLLALFRRHRHRAPDGNAQAARGYCGPWHREEIRGYRTLRPHRLRRKRCRGRSHAVAVEERQIPREPRAAHRRYAVLPLRSRWGRGGTEFPEGLIRTRYLPVPRAGRRLLCGDAIFWMTAPWN